MSNSPAFPVPSDAQDLGLTMRDYFAAKAMQGLLAADKINDWTDCKCAEYAYEMADQMLKKRGEL